MKSYETWKEVIQVKESSLEYFMELNLPLLKEKKMKEMMENFLSLNHWGESFKDHLNHLV